MINRIVEEIKKHELNIFSVTVIENGVEKTVDLAQVNPCNDIYSVSKAFIVTGIGMMYDDGLLSVDEKVVDIFADHLPAEYDEKWNMVTVHHLLTHSAGLPSGYLDIDCYDIHTYDTDDFLDLLFRTKLEFTPGERGQYSDGAFYMLSRVITAKCGEKADDLLMRRLFYPLGFREAAWSKCPHGYPIGATGLYIRTCDIARHGMVYLNKGVYNGKRILSEEWVDIALGRYEMGRIRPHSFAKGGMCGQMMVIDTKANISVGWEGYTNKDVSVLFDLFS